MKPEELRRRIAQHPHAVRYEDLARLLHAYGFQERASRSGTSHRYWVKGAKQISVPYKRPHVKRFYVEEVLRLIEGEGDD